MSRVEEIKKMLKNDPDDSFLCYALALEHQKSGNLKKATQIIEQLIERDPDYLGAYYRLGQLYEKAGKINRAIEVYQRGIVLSTKKNDFKSKGELEEALWLIEEEP